MPVSRRHTLALLGSLPFGALISPAVSAQTPRIYAHDGIAIDGTDPVAYFTQGRPVAGSRKITHKWRGVTWRFSSQENRAAFASDPQAYAPQYGGYCAWAVANGYTAKGDPDAWSVVDGKLYLNFSKSVRRRWSKDIPGNISRGNANWPAVLN